MLITIVVIILLLIIGYIFPLLETSKLPKITISRNFNNQTILLHRVWHNKYVNNKMFQNCHQKWLDLNPNICQVWYDFRDCEKLIAETQEPIVLECYKKLKPLAFKADLFRLCVLYKYGGVYVDASSKPFVSIKEMIKGCQSQNTFISVLSNYGIHNGLIISVPKHPFLKAAIKEIVNNVSKKLYMEHYLAITGPICLKKSLKTFLQTTKCFREGWNDFGNLSFYLYKFKHFPKQHICKKNKTIICKKHCFFSFITNKLHTSNYIQMWYMNNIYN